ncbi:MAG: hypothetical protein ABSB49_16660, partial [Polyangia bacterium]
DALAGAQGSWKSGAEWLERGNGDLHLTLRGPYSDLGATLSVEGEGVHIEAELARVLAQVRLDCQGVDTTWMVAPALRPLLGGRLQGSLRAAVHLAPSLAKMAAEIGRADLRLDRGARARGPRVLALRIGRFESDLLSPRRAPSAGDALLGGLRRVRLSHGRLDLEGARLAWRALEAEGDATIDFAGVLGRSQVSARASLAIGRDLLPAWAGRRGLRLSARAKGTLAELAIQLDLHSPPGLMVGGQRLALPARLALTWGEARGLALAPCLIAGGGGTVELAGSLDRDERLEVDVVLSHYALSALPGTADSVLGRELAGTLSGRLTLEGPLLLPVLAGHLRVPRLSLRGRSLGSANATLRASLAEGSADVQVGSALVAKVSLERAAPLTVAADLTLHGQELSPWLPGAWSVPPVAASGRLRLVYVSGRLPVVAGALDLAGPGLERVKLAASTQGEVITAELQGQIEVAPWRCLWSRYGTGGEGAVRVDLKAVHGGGGTQVSGDLLVVRKLVLPMGHGPGWVRIEAGDRLGFAGDSLSSPGLHLELPWFHGLVSGRLTPGHSDLAHGFGQAKVAAKIEGELDFAALPVELAGATLGGRGKIVAELQGALGDAAGPVVNGELDLNGLTMKSWLLPPVTWHGTVTAAAGQLTTTDLSADIAQVGRVRVGEAGSPAVATLLSLVPLRLGFLDIPISGSRLTIDGAHSASPVAIRDFDVNTRLTGWPGSRKLVGEVTVAGGVLTRARGGRKPSAGPERPWYALLPPGLALDLRVRGAKKAMRVAVPVLPDVTVDFDCRLQATRQGATLTGNLHGDSPYDRAVVDLYAWLAGKDLRRCRL